MVLAVVRILALLGAAYALLAILAVRRFAQRPPPPDPALAVAPAVTVLKPLHGAEPGLAKNVASFLDQDHPGEVQLVVGVNDPADAALGAIGHLGRVETVVDGRQHGPNRKVGNLANMMAAVRHDVIVIADSDMRVPPDYLRRVTAPLADPRVGLVTCLYRGVPASAGLWSALAAAGVNHHFLPAVLVGEVMGAASGCFGSTMVIRREVLDRLGGIERLAHHLADDHALGAAVRGLGLKVVLSPLLIDHMSHEPTWRALWAHELRWARTIRLLSPLGHAGMVVTHAIPAGLAALLLGGADAVSLGVLGLTVLARTALARTVDVRLGVRPPGWWLVVPRDLLSFAVFAASFLGRGVVWRGQRYAVDRSGLMTELGKVLP